MKVSTKMIYTDKEIDVLLDKANEIGFNTSLDIIRTFPKETQEKYLAHLRKGMREILELLPPPPIRTLSTVYCQPWWESRRGWGCEPNGYILHKDEANRDEHIQSWKKNRKGLCPTECFIYPQGDGYVLEVDEDTYASVQTAPYGLWKDGIAPGPLVPEDFEIGDPRHV